MATANPLKVTTPGAMVAHPWRDQPQKNDDSTKPAKYSASLVFPPGTDLTALKKAALAAVEAKWPGKSTDVKFMAGLHKPFRADPDDVLAKGYPEGSTFINVRTNNQPGLVYAHADPSGKLNAAGQPVPEVVPQEKIKETFYPGCKVRATLTAYGFDVSGKKGPTFALNNMQKVGEGERLDSRVAATEEFVADLSAAPADLDSLVG